MIGSKTLIDNIFVKNSYHSLHSGIVLTDISDHFLVYITIQVKQKIFNSGTIKKKKISLLKIEENLSKTLVKLTGLSCFI